MSEPSPASLSMGSLMVPNLGLGSGADLGAPLPRAAHRAQELIVDFGPPGDCPEHTDVKHLAFSDLSGSLGTAGLTGNDPAGLRHAAILKAAEKIGAVCTCGRETLQVLSFDLTSELDVGPCQLNPAGLRDLRRALSSTDVGWGISTLGPSLAAARTIVDDFDGKVTLTVMSDFILTDIPQILPDLASFPADSIHVVVLTAPPPAALADYPNITVTAAGWSDDPAIVAKEVYAEFTKFRPLGRLRPKGRSRRRSRR
jgi:hypothetical protein